MDEAGDTLRGFVPAALAYLVWTATTLVVLLAGCGRFGRRRAR
jgi:hypothetical protein